MADKEEEMMERQTEWAARRVHRSTYQLTGLVCAHCGEKATISNGGQISRAMVLQDGVLWFTCPACGKRYDLPFFNADSAQHS